jgi:hypothetical protein
VLPTSNEPARCNAPGGDPGGVEEIALLMSTQQLASLERAAHLLGLTPGQLMRRLLRDFLAEPAGHGPRPEG